MYVCITKCFYRPAGEGKNVNMNEKYYGDLLKHVYIHEKDNKPQPRRVSLGNRLMYVCMYVCMYICYVCMCVYLSIFVCMYVCLYTLFIGRVYSSLCVCMCLYVWTVCVCMYVYNKVFGCWNVCMYVCRRLLCCR